MNLDQITEMYIKIRDKKAAIAKRHKEELAPYNAKLEQVENAILAHFQKTGQTSSKTPHGTPYISTRTSATVDDRDAFIPFVVANKAYELLSNAIRKEALEEYIKETGEVPPGLKMSSMQTINVRR